jgi:hypothetical protein
MPRKTLLNRILPLEGDSNMSTKMNKINVPQREVGTLTMNSTNLSKTLVSNPT